jgi:hypothetical protein
LDLEGSKPPRPRPSPLGLTPWGYIYIFSHIRKHTTPPPFIFKPLLYIYIYIYIYTAKHYSSKAELHVAYPKVQRLKYLECGSIVKDIMSNRVVNVFM